MWSIIISISQVKKPNVSNLNYCLFLFISNGPQFPYLWNHVLKQAVRTTNKLIMFFFRAYFPILFYLPHLPPHTSLSIQKGNFLILIQFHKSENIPYPWGLLTCPNNDGHFMVSIKGWALHFWAESQALLASQTFYSLLALESFYQT